MANCGSSPDASTSTGFSFPIPNILPRYCSLTLPDVLPGHYKIVTIENGWDLEWASPAVLKTRLDHAENVYIRPNMTYQTAVNLE
jgi:hypothetical protein